jgi:hypothetical protein
MPSKLWRRVIASSALLAAVAAQGQDLHIKKTISVGGNVVSSTDTSIKGARQRDVTGNQVTIRQCDLKRTLSLNDQLQTYLVQKDAVEEKEQEKKADAAASAASGGTIVVTTTITDTGERKTMYGYAARHLKATIAQEPSADACTKQAQTFEIDGWYADVDKDLGSCAAFNAPVRQASGCTDKVVARHRGSGKAGYPLVENITFHNPDGSRMQLGIQTSEISKQTLEASLFDVPKGYREVASIAELNGVPEPQVAQQAQAAQQMQMGQQPQVPQQPTAYAPPAQPQPQAKGPSAASMVAMMNPMTGPAAAAAMQQKMGQVAQTGMGNPYAAMGGMPAGMGGMPAMQGQPTGAAVAAPQQLGPKAAGKIRIGVAPPEAQLGQGNNAGADYSTPIRNAEIALMSGPAVEIAPLDSHIALQLQAEAQQKQCDYILYSAVAVKHNQGGFGKFAKMGSMAASMTPAGMMAHGMAGAAAAQTAAVAASQMAQQQAMNQLAGFNGQIKSKDDVTVQYQLVALGQTTPILQNSLQGKAKSNGEDVLTPLLTQAATSVLTQVSQK